MDLIDVFGIEFNNNSEKVDQISFLKLRRRKIRVKIADFPLLMVKSDSLGKGTYIHEQSPNSQHRRVQVGNLYPFMLGIG